MVDELDGGILLVTQDDDVVLDQGQVGQVIHDAVPDLVLEISEQTTRLVQDDSPVLVTETEEVIHIVEDTATPDFIAEIVWGGPKGDTGPQGPQGPQGVQGDPGPRVTFVQPDAPVTSESTYLWIQTGVGNDDLTFWVEDGVV